jgi:hypothetical protein
MISRRLTCGARSSTAAAAYASRRGGPSGPDDRRKKMDEAVMPNYTFLLERPLLTVLGLSLRKYSSRRTDCYWPESGQPLTTLHVCL